MKRVILSLLLLVGVISAVGVGIAVTADAPDPDPAPVVAAMADDDPGLDGEKIFLAEKCNLCHSVSSADIEAKTKSEKVRGPDLAGVAERHDSDFLVGYLRQDVELEGEKHKKAFTGSDEEIGALVSWLLAQKAE
jgi:mono/diheme cytochrome c family protein